MFKQNESPWSHSIRSFPSRRHVKPLRSQPAWGHVMMGSSSQIPSDSNQHWIVLPRPCRVVNVNEWRSRPALIRAPDVLMLDEATTGLDGPAVEAVESLIVRLVDHGVTVLMATHNVLQARRLAERVIVLDEEGPCIGIVGEVEGALRGRPEARLLDGRWIG